MAIRFAHPDTAKNLGISLRKARQSLGWTQQTLAEKCGFERSQISKIENGHPSSPNKHVQRMCEVLGVPSHHTIPPEEAVASALAARINALSQASPELFAAVEGVLSALERLAAPRRTSHPPSQEPIDD